ncbi:MAG: hypothetical protein JO211_03945 [Acidobacteriaceae bacterium]|nr:hypothetical protein [Acidobacteriaceae bacterium]
METPDASIDELLRAAIDQKRLIRVTYKHKSRVVEPHDYGVHNGCIKLLGYQVAGSSSGPLPNWRWMEVPSLSDLHLLEQTFRGRRPSASDKHHQWDQLFKRVAPPE